MPTCLYPTAPLLLPWPSAAFVFAALCFLAGVPLLPLALGPVLLAAPQALSPCRSLRPAPLVTRARGASTSVATHTSLLHSWHFARPMRLFWLSCRTSLPHLQQLVVSSTRPARHSSSAAHARSWRPVSPAGGSHPLVAHAAYSAVKNAQSTDPRACWGQCLITTFQFRFGASASSHAFSTFSSHSMTLSRIGR